MKVFGHWNLFFLSVKNKYYKEQKEPEVPRSTQDVNKRGPKKASTTAASRKQKRTTCLETIPKTLPTPHPSQKIQNKIRIINTIQVSPSPQIGHEVSFHSRTPPYFFRAIESRTNTKVLPSIFFWPLEPWTHKSNNNYIKLFLFKETHDSIIRKFYVFYFPLFFVGFEVLLSVFLQLN